MYKISIFDISLTKSGFVIFLSENKTSPILPLVIGISEAQSINLALNGVEAERPLTHDLFKFILDKLQAVVIKIIITKIENGIFLAEVYLRTNDGILVIDSRPSDAIALAIRFKAPVYVADEVMQKAGIKSNEIDLSKAGFLSHAEVDFAPVTEEVILRNRLNEAIAEERYEEAALLREQIKQLTIRDKLE